MPRFNIPHRRSVLNSIFSPLRGVLLLMIVNIAGLASAQDSSDIFMAKIHTAADGTATVGDMQRLTDRDGYDNQPAFSSDGSLVYFTSMHTSTEGATQTDIWQVDLSSGKTSAVFETSESEYSPTLIPGADALSVVRVELDGSQKLWRLPLDGKEPSRILESLEPVGYHAWSDDQLVLFVLGEPHELRRASSGDSQTEGRTLAKDIGRSLHRIPDGFGGKTAFSFVHNVSKEGRSGTWVKSLEIEGDVASTLVRMPEGSEDVAWTAQGSLWTADGSKLLRWRAGESGWTEVADLSDQGVAGITRLAFDHSGERLAFVAARAAHGSE